MRAIIYEEFGSANEVLKLVTAAKPVAGAGEVLVHLRTSGVNPSDTKARAGARAIGQKPPFAQIIPHSDGAGVIVAVGEGVAQSRIGERVWLWNCGWNRAFGSAAEYIAISQAHAVPLADNASFVVGATLGIPALTACHCVLGSGPVKDKTLLISGGGGTVGHLAIQIAKTHGAEVITTVSKDEDANAATAIGADLVLRYNSPDLAEQIMEFATDGIDHVIEVEFGSNVATNAAVIKECGRIVAYGSAKNITPQIPFYPLMFKAVTLDLVLVYLLSDKARAQAITHVNTMLAKEQIAPRIAKTFPLSECAAAHMMVEGARKAGSVILQI
ncbi:MAG: NADPH:quinone reductase [Pseudomonadota bacterium]